MPTKKPSAILISGPSFSGKSTIARLLATNDSVLAFSVDEWMEDARSSDAVPENHRDAYQLLRDRCDLSEIDTFVNGLSNDEGAMLGSALFDGLPRISECVVIEGYLLGHRSARRMLTDRLKKAGFRIWDMIKRA